MARKRDYETLAKLKEKKKEIEFRIKEVEKRILNSSPKSQVETQYGVLSLVNRTNYSLQSNQDIIDYGVLTEQDIIQHAKLSPSELKKLIGEKSFDVLLEEGLVTIKGTTQYFCLKQSK